MASNASALDKANQLISELVNALDTIARSDNLEYAKGAATYAIARAEKARTLNSNGYPVIQ